VGYTRNNNESYNNLNQENHIPIKNNLFNLISDFRNYFLFVIEI